MICANGCLRGPTGLTSDEADAPPPPPLPLMLPPPEVESYNLSDALSLSKLSLSKLSLSLLHLRPSHNLSDESFWLVVTPGMMKITITFMSKDYLFGNVICDHTH